VYKADAAGRTIYDEMSPLGSEEQLQSATLWLEKGPVNVIARTWAELGDGIWEAKPFSRGSSEQQQSIRTLITRELYRILEVTLLTK
jgi:hypothetical protein